MFHRFWVWTVCAVCVSAGVAFGKTDVLPRDPDAAKRFEQAMIQIETAYVQPVSDQTLFYSAIRGMLMGLDPHSAYLDRKSLSRLQGQSDGQFVGIGLEIAQKNGLISVISPLEGSPAQKAGVRAGDLIVAVNRTLLDSVSLDEAIERIQGKKGTSVTLTLLHPGETDPKEVVLKRSEVDVQPVRSELLDGRYGYLRIAAFTAGVEKPVRDRVRKLTQQSGGRLSGLVLDLRNNPGGVLESAGRVADLFLNTVDPVFQTRGRLPGSNGVFRGTQQDILAKAPIVVLINEGSASCSEVVAGALQDYQRAVILGKRSFGKGSVQTVFLLDDQTAIKLTTAWYYTPKGRLIQNQGITPDIEVEEGFKLIRMGPDPWSGIREKNLLGHLTPQVSPGTPVIPLLREDESLGTSDYPLYAALQLLKSLAVLGKS